MATIEINKDWQITSDERNWVLQQRRVIKKSKVVENIGKDIWEVDGYYPTLISAVKGLVEKSIKVPADLAGVVRKLEELNTSINNIKGWE